MRARVQFGLPTIFIVTALCAAALACFIRAQQLHEAAERHDKERYLAEHFVVVCEGSYHRYRSSEHANDDPQTYVRAWRAVAEYHARLRDKCQSAIWRPWLSLSPDPPSPPVPDWPEIDRGDS
jgi:hypothetical protein